MSEQATEQTADTKTQKQGEPADAPLGDGGKKALDAERTRAKELEKQLNAATTKLTEIERANESAIEKAQREATEAKEAAGRAMTDALRFKIAAESGISENVDLILTAGDEETMRRQAALWSERASAAPSGPRPDLSQGGKGESALALNGDGLEEALKSKLGI